MSTDRILVCTPDVIMTPVLEKLYTLKPKSFQHLNLRGPSVWQHPVAGYRAQAALVLRQLGKRVAANRLATATKQDLKDYVASEYDTVPETGNTYAIGEVSFVRPLALTAGDIPKGTRLKRAANLTTQLPLRGADYETLVDVHFDVGQLTAGPIPIRSLQASSAGNHPVRVGETIAHGVSVPSLFDPRITVSTFSAAGGSDDADDDYVKLYARAFAVGQFGPTEGATRLGVLRATGVRNLLVYDLPGTGTEVVLVGDSDWASSNGWVNAVQQSLYDSDLIGVGCKVVVQGVTNKVVSVVATVALRDRSFLSDTTEITNSIRAAVVKYLDKRRDWSIWKTSGLQAAITGAHHKIFNCSSAVMKNTANVTVPEITTPDFTQTQYHYMLANGAVKITYVGPS